MLSEESINLANKEIAKNRKYFDKWLQFVRKAPNDEEELYRIWGAALFASSFYSGILSCLELEEELVRIAKTIPFESSNITYNPNSFLHVFTWTDNYGGHTRVVERWIQSAPQGQIHSVLYTDQRFGSVADIIYSNTKERNGEVIIQPSSYSFKEKAVQLREIASRYEYVILHINPYDIVPILAFGSLDFKRPVLFYNHTDHLFWIGGSVADAVINFRHFSEQINIQRRGVDRNLFLPLPIVRPKEQIANLSNHNIKQALSIDESHQILLTMARSKKYRPQLGYDFVRTVTKLLEQTEKVSFIAIGPHKDSYWKKLEVRFPDRVRILGVIPNEEVLPYLEVSDIVWDSFPLGSLTALLDSAKLHKPVLSLETPGLMGLYDTANIKAPSEEILIQKTIDILSGKIQYEGRLYEYMEQCHFEENWRILLQNMLDNAPKEHKVWNINSPSTSVTEFEYGTSLFEMTSGFQGRPAFLRYFYTRAISKMQKLKLRHPNLVAKIRTIALTILNCNVKE